MLMKMRVTKRMKKCYKNLGVKDREDRSSKIFSWFEGEES